jgi:pSer/pThr/pTyr-binding forkhead associated (FHA) protein
MAVIEFLTGSRAGEALLLPDISFTIGRSDDADVNIQDDGASRIHAEMTPTEDGWLITDLESANGTFVNAEPTARHALQDRDVIQIGDSKIAFLLDMSSVGSVSADAVQVAETTAPQSTADAAPAYEPPAPEPVYQEEVVHEELPRYEAPTRPQPTAPAATQEDLALVRVMRDRTNKIRDELAKVIVGQADVILEIMLCIISGGHALLIGMPGMAKTLTVATLAKVLNLNFKRVQFTPDLMPSDIIGTDVLETDQSTGEKVFRFIRGPLFCNLLLADEINRTPPKTQAALLEAMQEKCVTAGNTTYKLDKPFFVLATQNPVEQEGTYPLPEAQLDRFMFNIWVDYPLEHEEEEIIRATTAGTPQTVNPCHDAGRNPADSGRGTENPGLRARHQIRNPARSCHASQVTPNHQTSRKRLFPLGPVPGPDRI